MAATDSSTRVAVLMTKLRRNQIQNPQKQQEGQNEVNRNRAVGDGRPLDFDVSDLARRREAVSVGSWHLQTCKLILDETTGRVKEI